MKFRTTAWLFLVVCLLGVLVWIMEDHVESTSERLTRQMRLLPFDLARVTMLELATAEFHVVCVKRDDAWHIERPLVGRA